MSGGNERAGQANDRGAGHAGKSVSGAPEAGQPVARAEGRSRQEAGSGAGAGMTTAEVVRRGSAAVPRGKASVVRVVPHRDDGVGPLPAEGVRAAGVPGGSD